MHIILPVLSFSSVLQYLLDTESHFYLFDLSLFQRIFRVFWFDFWTGCRRIGPIFWDAIFYWSRFRFKFTLACICETFFRSCVLMSGVFIHLVEFSEKNLMLWLRHHLTETVFYIGEGQFRQDSFSVMWNTLIFQI